MSSTGYEWQREVLKQRAVGAPAKNVASVLANRHNDKTGQCTPRQDTIATDCGRSTSSVREALGSLVQAKLIEVQPRRQQQHGRGRTSDSYALLPLDGIAPKVWTGHPADDGDQPPETRRLNRRDQPPETGTTNRRESDDQPPETHPEPLKEPLSEPSKKEKEAFVNDASRNGANTGTPTPYEPTVGPPSSANWPPPTSQPKNVGALPLDTAESVQADQPAAASFADHDLLTDAELQAIVDQVDGVEMCR